jgi:hypothetical protein
MFVKHGINILKRTIDGSLIVFQPINLNQCYKTNINTIHDTLWYIEMKKDFITLESP